MIRYILLLGTFLILTLSASVAQRVSNIQWEQDGTMLVVTYDLSGGKFYETFNIELYVSLDGGANFTGPLRFVEGDVGEDQETGRQKTIRWDVLQEDPTFTGGNIVFDVQAISVPKPLPKKFYIGYNASLSAPYGVTIGMAGKTGFYLSARLKNASIAHKYETDSEDGSIEGFPGTQYYTYNGTSDFSRMSVTGGLSFQAGWKTHIYLGAGFARGDILNQIDVYSYQPADQKVSSDWVRKANSSFANVEAEAGLHFNYKYFYFSLGIALLDLQYPEAVGSLGFTIGKSTAE